MGGGTFLSSVNMTVRTLLKRSWNFILQQANAQQAAFEEQEKRYLRKVLIEERTRYCTLATCFRPVVVGTFLIIVGLILNAVVE